MRPRQARPGGCGFFELAVIGAARLELRRFGRLSSLARISPSAVSRRAACGAKPRSATPLTVSMRRASSSMAAASSAAGRLALLQAWR